MNPDKKRVLVIAAVAVLSIIGIVAYLLWAFSAEEARNGNNKASGDGASETKSTNYLATDTSFGTGATVVFPEGWKYEHTYTGYDDEGLVTTSRTTLSNPTKNTSKITSPSGNIIVKMELLRSGGMDSGCVPAEHKIMYIKREEIPEFPGTLYLEYIERRPIAGTQVFEYFYKIGAARSETVMNAVTETSGNPCDLSFAHLITVEPAIQNEDTTASTLILTMQFDPLRATTSALDVDTIKKLMQGDEYETAKGIIKSLYRQ